MMVSTRSMLVAVTAAAACFIDGARGTYGREESESTRLFMSEVFNLLVKKVGCNL